MKKNIIGLIPTRLNSQRLPQKALLEIQGIPLIIHTYRRSLMSKKLTDLYICCDDKKIFNIAKKFNAKCIMTSKNHSNGTERIAEAATKLKIKPDLVVDIQGDEPLISPFHIDQVVDYHLKNSESEIILPTLKIKPTNNTNIVKVLKNKKNKVMYLSRSNIPFEFKGNKKFIFKHLSIISFKFKSLLKFAQSKKTYHENIEDIELLRALDLDISIESINLKGDSFSVDVLEDYKTAQKKMLSDKFFKIYKNK